jgi:hypothetical protein
MIGIEEAYCDAGIRAVLSANSALRLATIEDALQPSHVYKGDTLGLDAIPEINIAERITQFDQYAILVSEERGYDKNPLGNSSPSHDRGLRTYFVSDPCDRSIQFKLFLDAAGDRSARVGEVFDREDARTKWEKEFGAPASITGPYTAITCVRRGLPICAVLLNFLTQELTVACSGGVYHAKLSRDVDGTAQLPEGSAVAAICKHENRLYFRQVSAGRVKHFVTFLGKSGYAENFRDNQLMRAEQMEASLHHRQPGGPSRVLYLSTLQPENESIGFILANGEKIGEWIHWLPFVRFATKRDDFREPALRLFELSHDRPWTRDGILMSTSPVYSIFKVVDSQRSRMELDTDRLRGFPNPSKCRATLLAIPASNHWAIQYVQQYGHRPIVF